MKTQCLSFDVRCEICPSRLGGRFSQKLQEDLGVLFLITDTEMSTVGLFVLIRSPLMLNTEQTKNQL